MATSASDQPAPREPFGAAELPPARYKGHTSHSTYVPMRDGVRLAVDVHLPKGLAPDSRIPALLSQTRYWRDMELRIPFKWFLKVEDLDPHTRGFKPLFTGHGYALVMVDVRGTGASYGSQSHPWPDESIEDAREIVDWIVGQPWSNGRVGAYGISYLGTTAELTGLIHHPAVKAIVPQFNHPDPYRDIGMPGGLFNQRFIGAWSQMNEDLDRNQVPGVLPWLARALVKGVMPVNGDRQALAEAVRDHSTNGNAFELSRTVLCRDERSPNGDMSSQDIAACNSYQEIGQAQAAIFGWGSWMDAGTADATLRRFLSLENAPRAVIGAWDHGARFHASPYRLAGLPPDPSPERQWAEMIHFFDPYLKGEGAQPDEEPKIQYYTMGAEVWQQSPVWPPGRTSVRWYLAPNNALASDAPSEAEGADRYPVDFQATTGDHNRWWELGAASRETVIYPNRATQSRHVLSYTSSYLDRDLEITGYPTVTLYLTATVPDVAVYVYLEDVDPGGRSTYVTEGELRAIHRRLSQPEPPFDQGLPYHSFSQQDTMPLVPGEPAELRFALLPTSVLFRQGHRIRVTIAGHDEGTFARVPDTGEPIIEVLRRAGCASYIELPLIEPSAVASNGR